MGEWHVDRLVVGPWGPQLLSPVWSSPLRGQVGGTGWHAMDGIGEDTVDGTGYIVAAWNWG